MIVIFLELMTKIFGFNFWHQNSVKIRHPKTNKLCSQKVGKCFSKTWNWSFMTNNNNNNNNNFCENSPQETKKKSLIWFLLWTTATLKIRKECNSFFLNPWNLSCDLCLSILWYRKFGKDNNFSLIKTKNCRIQRKKFQYFPNLFFISKKQQNLSKKQSLLASKSPVPCV